MNGRRELTEMQKGWYVKTTNKHSIRLTAPSENATSMAIEATVHHLFGVNQDPPS